MNILVVCPECKRQLEVPESAAGKAIRCPSCESVIPADPQLPERESVTSAPVSPPPALLARSHEQVRDDFADGELRRKKKPIRKGASLGLILGLVGGGVLLFLIVVGGGVGLLVYLALNRTIPEEEWRPFSPPNSGCTILMPGTPVPESQTINGILLNKHQVERKTEKAAFGVASVDLGFKLVKPDALEVLTKAERDYIEGRTNGKVTSESAISLGNLPGREFQVVPKDGGLIIERLYLAKVGSGHRVYVLVAGGDYIKPNKGDAARFFDSFQLTVPATPPEFGVGPVAQVPQPPVANPLRPNPVRPVQPQRRPAPKRRANQSAPPGERAVWSGTSSSRTLAMAFAPDSKTLAVGQWDKKLRLWDVTEGKDRQLIAVDDCGSVMAVAFSGDGKRLACGTDNGDLSEAVVLIWDVSDVNAPKRSQRIPLRHTRDKARAKALCFTPDGKGLAVALVPDSHSGSQVVLWDLENNKENAAYRDCKEDVKKLAFTSGGAIVILMPSSVRVWDPVANQIRREIKAQNPAEQFISSAVSPDGQTLASLGDDKKLKLWRLASGECLQTWPANADVIRQAYFPLEFSPDGKYLALGGRGSNLYLWSAQTGKELKVTKVGAGYGFIDVLAFSPDGRLLACNSSNGARIFEVPALLAGN